MSAETLVKIELLPGPWGVGSLGLKDPAQAFIQDNPVGLAPGLSLCVSPVEPVPIIDPLRRREDRLEVFP